MSMEPLRTLAEIYQQLYLDPNNIDSAKEYKDIVLCGQNPISKSLSHFIMSEKDSLELVETPVGDVQIITLYERKDFETFLHIMVGKCVAYDIPASQGASMLNGVINWHKINKHKEEWIREQLEKRDKAQGDNDAGEHMESEKDFGWREEFKRFTSDKKNFKDALIVLSAGPYSNISSTEFGFDEKEWIEKSLLIRKYHECTHFFCRRKYPELIDAIWDEVVADAIGIIAAFGEYDALMEEKFLGISSFGYTGGRLANYVKNDEDINAVAKLIHGWIMGISKLYEEKKPVDVFDFVCMLERRYRDL